MTPKRKLDFFISVYNRAECLFNIIKSGLSLNLKSVYFVVFDDCSDKAEHIEALGRLVTPAEVCANFDDERIIYLRNSTNIGFAKTLERYFNEVCDAEYMALLNPKDVFISGKPIIDILKKLDNDFSVSMAVYPIRQRDQLEEDRPMLFNYKRMKGLQFISSHINDPILQHCSSYSIMRVTSIKKAHLPRNMDLRALGLEDGSGIDHDLIFNVATTGDVEFASEPALHRSTVGGYTELFPLTFAYTQYQYARRLMIEFGKYNLVSLEDKRKYLSFWHLIIARGLIVAYRPIHGTELEKGIERIRPHLKVPMLLYLPLECFLFRIKPSKELRKTYCTGARLLISDWWQKITMGNKRKLEGS